MEQNTTGNINAEALTPQDEQIQFLTFQNEKKNEEIKNITELLNERVQDMHEIMRAWREQIEQQINAYNQVNTLHGDVFPVFKTRDSIETIDEILTTWKENNLYAYENQILEAVDCEIDFESGWRKDEATISVSKEVGDIDDLMESIKNDILTIFREEDKQ